MCARKFPVILSKCIRLIHHTNRAGTNTIYNYYKPVSISQLTISMLLGGRDREQYISACCTCRHILLQNCWGCYMRQYYLSNFTVLKKGVWLPSWILVSHSLMCSLISSSSVSWNTTKQIIIFTVQIKLPWQHDVHRMCWDGSSFMWHLLL